MNYYLTDPIKLESGNFRLFGNNTHLLLAVTDPEDKKAQKPRPVLRYTQEDKDSIKEYIGKRLNTLGYSLESESIDKLINELLSLRTKETNYNKEDYDKQFNKNLKYWEGSLESEISIQGNTKDLDGQILLISKDIAMSSRVNDIDNIYTFWLMYASNNEYVLFVKGGDNTEHFTIKSEAKPDELEENNKYYKELEELEKHIKDKTFTEAPRIRKELVETLKNAYYDNIKNNKQIKDSIENETINLFISLEIDKRIPNDLRIHKINDNFSLIKTSDKLAIYEFETKEYYIFNSIGEIPENVIYKLEKAQLQKAILGKTEELYRKAIDPQVLDLIIYTDPKPVLDTTQTKKDERLIYNKRVLEDYYKIKVNADKINDKYYFNYETRKYELINILRFGHLLETEHNLTLSDTDLNNIYKMFRNVQQPNNDAIAFNNCVLDTTDFKKLPLDVFTVKQLPYDYKPLNECEKGTLIEETLKKILIPANDPENTVLYEDFLQRVGASFKRENIHKIINFYNGSGNDGKSTLLKILSYLHSDLAMYIKPKNLQDDNYMPNLSNLNVMLMEELNKNSLRGDIVELMKDMSGRGQRDTRIIYTSETQTIKDFGMFFIATNILPMVDFSNKAYWERAIILKVPNKFENNEDKENNIYLADPDIESKLATDTDGIEWLISASIEAYLKRPDNEFKIMQTATETQFMYDGANPIRIFIETFIIRTDNKEDIISNKEISLYLMQWAVKQNFTKEDLKVYTINELSQEIGAKLKNHFKDLEDLKQKAGKHGATAYRCLAINLDNVEEKTKEDLNIELENWEEQFF